MNSLSRGNPTGRAIPSATAAVSAQGSELSAVKGAAGIAAYLRRAILDGVYLYGERLPAERQLAESLSSSRATVRAAMRVLEQDNLVTRRVGSGTFVSHGSVPVEDDVAEITSPLELIEVRLAVEPHMMRLATLNATARAIERMADVLARLEASGADANLFSQWDQQFHQALADATRNPLMVSIYRQINHVRGHAQWNDSKDKILTAERIKAYNRQHRALYHALRSRDAEVAVRVIAKHLRDAQRDLLAV